ncbi:MAG: Proline-tRNA ligase [Parcubacteria group bacterium GW2011_GWA2_38_13]|nr:MAG: Proline-tRNA ligase [Parcubacteria group bacterium GW2011_GWA2_38_13]
MPKEDKNEQKALTKRSDDFSQWYQDVIVASDLAENAPVRGCMIIKPYGYALWENIQKEIDAILKDMGIENAYFPLLIPESYFKREADHVKGFSPELAVVTHGGGKKLEEPLVIRPTSETIIYDAFSRWIHSYRDLPFVVNQWANVVRWEMRPRLFLRTTEFLWQEGHTAHATAQDAKEYALMILDKVYKKFAQEYLAIPVFTGQKSESEKFAGALSTYCIEALMQDGKSLQMGTSHDLSDHFAKSFHVQYLDDSGERKFVHQTSWGVSTRLIGGIIMAHGDDKGLIFPPKIAPIKFVIIPICKNADEPAMSAAKEIFAIVSKIGKGKLDERLNLRAGEKFYEWEKKGVPVRIEIGPKDLEKKSCVIVRRDTGEKESCPIDAIVARIQEILDDIQKNLYARALEKRDASIKIADDWIGFTAGIEKGGYVFAYWCEEAKCEEEIKEKTKATSRCLPFDGKEEKGEHVCVHCKKPVANKKRWVFAKAY